MNLLVFGTGRFYKNRRYILDKMHDVIMAFLDNRAEEIGYTEEKKVYYPWQIGEIKYDVILLMSGDAGGMRRQLLQLGVDNRRIWDWEHYVGEKCRGHFYLRLPDKADISKMLKKRVAIVTTRLDYNGASMAVLYSAVALQRRGYSIALVTYEADECLVGEILKMGICVIIAPGLHWPDKVEMIWLCMFDLILVNTFQMVRIACMLSQNCPVVWWIHEPDGKNENIYRTIQEKFTQDVQRIMGSKMLVYAVSNIAAFNFRVYYPSRVDGLLPYGIPDVAMGAEKLQNKVGRFVFAVIGGVTERKAQGIVLQAVELLPYDLRQIADFWIIGNIGEYGYGMEIKRAAAQIPEVKILGQLSRAKMEDVFSSIDVVICPSVEDPLPIVITEGWMHSKVCIMSDATGQVDMTEDGINGLICKAGDAQSLADKMTWVLQNQDKLDEIRKKGRETYERYFSMESFGERLEQALLAAERKFNEKRD